MKKILFILSGNLSTTPRARKNILTAAQYYRVYILKVNRHPVWNTLDEKWIAPHNYPVESVSLGRKPFLLWLHASLLHKFARLVWRLFPRSLFLSAYASQKVSILLTKKAQKISFYPDFVIGQGGGALYPAYVYSRFLNIPFGFDTEDYHPGETIGKTEGRERKRRKLLLKKILPHANYVSYASPLIGKYTLNLLDNLPKQHVLITNSFPRSEFIPPNPPQSSKLHFVWFSQNIDYGRGLEQIITAASKFREKLRLTLIGNARPDFIETWLKPNMDFVQWKEPMAQASLHNELALYDIGLAIELNETDFNRQICWTNKLFAYAQAGLYILATDTQGQTDFMHNHPSLGEVCGQHTKDFENHLQSLVEITETIRSNAYQRYQYAKALSWENQREKFLNALESALDM